MDFSITSTDLIVEAAFRSSDDLFAVRPTIKPSLNEWTNFAAIVASVPTTVASDSTSELLASAKTRPNVTLPDLRPRPSGSPPGSGQALYGESLLRAKKIQTICLATGTKCLSADAVSDKGDLVNDSHAEVLARRGLIRHVD
jgi:Adenosine-deaminase (editase) domain